jgi:hypothetical protein
MPHASPSSVPIPINPNINKPPRQRLHHQVLHDILILSDHIQQRLVAQLHWQVQPVSPKRPFGSGYKIFGVPRGPKSLGVTTQTCTLNSNVKTEQYNRSSYFIHES